MKGYLNSGETYSLKDIFISATNGKIVIPDLQRDYCWGGKGTLVADFVNNIKRRFEECQKDDDGRENKYLTLSNAEHRKKTVHSLMMGLLYGYYEENRPNLQLCDGQQRLTTLYLLIGYINRMCGDNNFHSFLISNYELEEDDKEPNLLYDIRDCPRYFLSDLVCNFFVQERTQPINGSLSEFIKLQNWWFKEYESDPTIRSILAAMDEIQSLLYPMNKDDLKSFGIYICEMLHFVFFDMGDRKNGEETFVIINTTGEPLTATENLKPLIVTQGSSSESEWERNSRQWEEVDHWFWLHRDKNCEDTSDAGMKEFLRWVAAIHPIKFSSKEAYYQLLGNKDYVFPFREFDMKDIKMAFDALKQLNEDKDFLSNCNLLSAPKGKMYNLKDYFVILPTLKHFIKFGDKEAATRIYSFFRNLARYVEINAANNNLILGIETIVCMEHADVCSLLDIESQLNTTYILTEEEKTRLAIIREKAMDKTLRREIEKNFEMISTHDVLSGRINCLIACSMDDSSTFDFNQFIINVERFEYLFHRGYENVADDKTVLSFAAFCQEKETNVYPIANGNYRDFGYYASEWNIFIYGDRFHENHIQLFGDFIREIDEKDTSIDRIISRLNGKELMYQLITKNIPYTIWHGEWRKRLSIHPTSGLIRLFRNASYKSDNDVYLLGEEVLECRNRSGNWNRWNFYEDNDGYCLYTDHKEYDIAMDLMFNEISENQYSLRVFKRNDYSKKELKGLGSLLTDFSSEGSDGRMVSRSMSAKEVINFIDIKQTEIQKRIDDNAN